jgi:hypothetical protein
VATEATWLNGNHLKEKRDNKEEERKNERTA